MREKKNKYREFHEDFWRIYIYKKYQIIFVTTHSSFALQRRQAFFFFLSFSEIIGAWIQAKRTVASAMNSNDSR